MSKHNAGRGYRWVSNFLIFKYTTGSAAEVSYRFCTVTAPSNRPFILRLGTHCCPPTLCAVWTSPLALRGLRVQAAKTPCAERYMQQAWLFLCCPGDSHTHSDILWGQPPWLTLVEFTQHLRSLPIFPVRLAWWLSSVMPRVLQCGLSQEYFWAPQALADSADEEKMIIFFLVQTVLAILDFWLLWMSLCGSKATSPGDHCAFQTVQHRQETGIKDQMKSVLGSFYFIRRDDRVPE